MDLLQRILECNEEDIDTIIQQAIEEADFNIVKRKNDYAVLDYSCPITSFNREGAVKGYYPFVGTLSNKEFLEFTNNGTVKAFENYEFIEGKRISTKGERLYVVGSFEIDKKKIKTDNELSQEVISEIEDSQLER